MTGCVLTLLLLAMLGCLLVNALLSEAPTRVMRCALVGVMGPPIGLFVGAGTLFVSASCYGSLSMTAAIVDTIVLSVVTVVAAFRVRWMTTTVERLPSPGVGLAMVLAMSALCVAVVTRSLAQPHGGWDAWAIWNLRAKLLAGGTPWNDLFHGDYAHEDYPLGLPLIVARFWIWMGGFPVAVPIGVAVLSAVSIPAVVGLTVWIRRGPILATLSVLLLIGNPSLVNVATIQYADIHVALFMVMATAVLCLAEQPRDFLLVGLLAGLTAWIKNEGLVFLLSTGLSCGCRHLLPPRRRAIRSTGLLALGAAAPILIVAGFKMIYAPDNDLVAGQSPAETIDRLFDAERAREIGRAFAGNLLRLFSLNGQIWPLVGFSSIMGFGGLRRWSGSMIAAAAAIVLMYIAYFLTFLTTPQPLSWHLATAASRVLFQLQPATVLMLFLAFNSPDEIDRSGPWFVSWQRSR